MVLSDPWLGLVDDAAIFPPGNADLGDAVAAHVGRSAPTGPWWRDLVASFVVTDVRIPEVGTPLPLSVVVTGGAGAIAGAARIAARHGHDVRSLEVALRDPADLVGNVRRVDAAVRTLLDEGTLTDEVPVHVEIPGPAGPAWLAAADEVAACDFRLKFRLGHVDHDLIPDSATVAAWIDAALDREAPFKGTAGLHRAVRHDPEGGGAHGFLNVMVATRALLDGASRDDAVALLEERDGAVLAGHDLGSIRRWFTSFGTCSVREPLDDLIDLSLVEAPL